MAVRHECWVETFKHDESKRVMSWTFEDQERTFDYVYGCDVSKDYLPVMPSVDDLVTLITVGVDFDSIDFLPSGRFQTNIIRVLTQMGLAGLFGDRQ